MHDYCQRGTFRFVAFFQHGAGDVSKWRSPNSFKNGDGRWVKDEGLWVVSLAILQLVRPKVSAWVNKALELLTSLAMVDMVDWKALIWSVVQRLENIDTTNRWEVQTRSFKTSKRPRNERDKKTFDWSPFYLSASFFLQLRQVAVALNHIHTAGWFGEASGKHVKGGLTRNVVFFMWFFPFITLYFFVSSIPACIV